MDNISLLSAFIGGLLTFLSPCILPLIPGYLSFITGMSLQELKTGKPQKTMTNALFFVLGFSIVFILLGASATLLGQVLLDNLRLFNKIGGIILILLGIHVTGLVQIKLFNYDARIHAQRTKASWWSAFIVGFIFAFGWSPCIGPLLAGILLLASNQQTAGQGVLLLSTYSLGLAIPFLITALVLDKFLIFFNAIRKYFRLIELTSGALLIIIGILIFNDLLLRLSF